MASEGIPDQTAPAGDGEPAAARPCCRRSNPLALAWHYNRAWLVMSFAAGIATGGSFLMMALVMREVGLHPPVAIITAAVGGIALLIASPAWVIYDTWLDVRQLAELPAMPDSPTE